MRMRRRAGDRNVLRSDIAPWRRGEGPQNDGLARGKRAGLQSQTQQGARNTDGHKVVVKRGPVVYKL